MAPLRTRGLLLQTRAKRLAGESSRAGSETAATGRPEPASDGGFWSACLASLQSVRNVVVSLVAIAAGVAVAALFVTEVMRSEFEIGQFSVPQEWSERGISSEVVGEQLHDAILDIEASATDATQISVGRYGQQHNSRNHPSDKRDPSSRSLDIITQPSIGQDRPPNFTIPETSVTVTDLADYVRRLIGVGGVVITGEVIKEDGSTYRLRLRKNADPLPIASPSHALPTADRDALVKGAAEDIVNSVEPIVYAAYLFNSGQRYDALSAVQDIVARTDERDRDRYEALNLWGLILADARQFDEAIDKFNQANDVATKQHVRKYDLAYIYMGNAHYAAGKYKEAVGDFEQATRIKSDDAYAYSGLGWAQYDDYETDVAIASFKKAIALQPQNSDAYLGLGLSYQDKAASEDEIAAFRQAAALDPRSSAACRWLGWALFDTAKYTDAIATFRRLVLMDPELPDGHNGLGASLLQVGSYDGAIAEFDRVIELDPTFANAYGGLGWSLRSKRLSDAAIMTFRKAIKLGSFSAYTYDGLGYALQDKGYALQSDGQVVASVDALNASISAFDKAILADAKYKDAYDGLGWSLRAKGLADAAIMTFHKAIELGASSADMYDGLGYALQDKGYALQDGGQVGASIEAFDASIKAFDNAIRTDKNYKDAYDGLGWSQKGRGELDAAISSFSRAIELDDATFANPSDELLGLGNSLEEKAGTLEHGSKDQTDLLIRACNAYRNGAATATSDRSDFAAGVKRLDDILSPAQHCDAKAVSQTAGYSAN